MDIARLIQSAVAPVFLLTGVAATLGVLTNRLARIVDRARTLEQRLEGHPGSAQHLHADLAVLARRARYINWAISMCAIAALLVALVVVTLFANAFLRSYVLRRGAARDRGAAHRLTRGLAVVSAGVGRKTRRPAGEFGTLRSLLGHRSPADLARRRSRA